MIKLFKNRIVLASALFGLVNLVGGFVIAAPILIYLRILYENTESSLHLWPLPSIDIILDFLLNHNDVFIFYVITAAVITGVIFFFKSYIYGGIYSLLMFEKGDPNSIRSARDLNRKSAEIWIGFVKVGLFGVVAYGLAIFIGLVFGSFFGRLSPFFPYLILALFLLLASTYLQILKIHIVSTSDTSLKGAIGETRQVISGSLPRLFIGNISVSVAAFIAVLIIWLIMKGLKSAEWNILVMILTILVQQLMVFIISVAQSIRINFNFLVIKKGAEGAVGGDELG